MRWSRATPELSDVTAQYPTPIRAVVDGDDVIVVTASERGPAGVARVDSSGVDVWRLQMSSPGLFGVAAAAVDGASLRVAVNVEPAEGPEALELFDVEARTGRVNWAVRMPIVSGGSRFSQGLVRLEVVADGPTTTVYSDGDWYELTSAQEGPSRKVNVDAVLATAAQPSPADGSQMSAVVLADEVLAAAQSTVALIHPADG